MTDGVQVDYLGRIRPEDGRVYVFAPGDLKPGIAHCDVMYHVEAGEAEVWDVCPVTGERSYGDMRLDVEIPVPAQSYFWARQR